MRARTTDACLHLEVYVACRCTLPGCVRSALIGTTGAGTDVAADVRAALAGRWAGVLEYRDYKEPASSLKRVALPTWLQVQTTGAAKSWQYIYDYGPNKIVQEEERVVLDSAQDTVTMTEHRKSATGLRCLSLFGRKVQAPSSMRVAQGSFATLRMTAKGGRVLLTMTGNKEG